MKSLSPYPYNLLDDIFEEPYRDIIDEDIQEGIDYAVSTLRERERSFVSQYYKDGLPLDEIAKENNLTRERTRQIIRKAVSNLRHPSRIFYISRGYAVASGMLREQVEARYADAIAALEAEYTEKVRELYNKIVSVNVRLDGKEKSSETPEQILSLIDTPLCELDLSIRAYNALARAGVKTLGDVCNMSLSELSEIRNMGKKSVREILTMVESMGFKLKDALEEFERYSDSGSVDGATKEDK